MWPLHTPTPHFFHDWDAASLLPAPDIPHLKTPVCHLCIGIHLCMLIFTRFVKFRLWFKKNVYRATGPIFKNQLTRTKVFFPGLILAMYYVVNIKCDIACQNQAFVSEISC